MELTWEEIKSIANRLDELVSDNFHDAMCSVLIFRVKRAKNGAIGEQDVDYDFGECYEDIKKIKEQLKRIL
jgi:hypothetical protein